MNVYTTVTDSYGYSGELALSLSLFRQALPEGSHLSALNRGKREPSDFLGEYISEEMKKNQLPDAVLVVKEPALLAGKDCVAEMQSLLDAFPHLDCILPSDIRGFRPGFQADYMTLHSFERFVSRLRQEQDNGIMPYDGREPVMFLIRTDALRHCGQMQNLFSIPAILGKRTAISAKAYIHPFLNYYEEKREEAIPLIPAEAKSVLDIGCSRGCFGSALKSARSCRIVGIEQNPDEGEKARKFLDKVIIGDALEVRTEERFDCVVCLDTLEHFPNPSEMLAKIRNEFLSDNGYLLTAVPNVGHWSIVESLMAGRWDYLPVGIQCNTHMRFYTLHSMRCLLEQNRFQIVEVVSIPAPMPEFFQEIAAEFARKGHEADIQSLNAVSYLILSRRS